MRKHKLRIIFWNEDDDNTKEIIIDTDYPEPEDIEDTLCANDQADLKDYGGNFDWYEIQKIY